MQQSRLVERFLRYASIETTSSPTSGKTPSTEIQFNLARLLAAELEEAGCRRIRLTRECIVMAEIPASPGCEDCPAVGFLSHMDTSPDAPGAPLHARIARFDGSPIVLNEETGAVLSASRFPELARYRGQDIIVTDGTTLLGADDKAGIAAIMEMADFLHEHPETPHAAVKIAFTPDEEIGLGVMNFNIRDFGADYAFTVDSSEMGRLDACTFNAAEAKVTFRGISVHPGTAKGKMVNAIRLAMRFLEQLPPDEVPEKTEGYEGYYHPNGISGTTAEAAVRMIIRDHDTEKFEARKAFVEKLAASFGASASLEMHDQYYNMARFLAGHEWIIDLARKAYASCGVEVIDTPERGGTDGAQLSARGLPCPNIFSGGLNYHGPFEYLPVKSLEKSAEVVREIVRLSAEVAPKKQAGPTPGPAAD